MSATYIRADWTYEAALDAVGMRRTGMSYSSIAKALGYFHGIRVTDHAVRHLCRGAGCAPVHCGARGQNLQRTVK